jgi:8-oxo-dGTP pyrophosphatase MutT (NUDIX family)
MVDNNPDPAALDPTENRLNRAITLDEVRQALMLPDFDVRSAQLRMAPKPRPIRREGLPGDPRRAAVLILLYPLDGSLHFALTRRTDTLGVHSGQISLPGGSRDDGETFEQTALRETNEELGVQEPVEIIGQLTMIYVPPSDFEITPFVGYLPTRPVWTPNAAEVAELLEVSISQLFDDNTKGIEQLTAPDGVTRTFPFYRVSGYKVWGATAAMLSELEERLRIVLALPH